VFFQFKSLYTTGLRLGFQFGIKAAKKKTNIVTIRKQIGNRLDEKKPNLRETKIGLGYREFIKRGGNARL